jgi:hypothetical protein
MNRGDPCCAPNNDWGGTRGACFEPEGINRGGDWQLVGLGRGSYEQVKNYNYVGQGVGSFEPVHNNETYYGWRMRTCAVGVIAVVALLVGVWLISPYFQNHYEAAYARGRGAASRFSSAGGRFDCDNAISRAAQRWSSSHREWCCHHYGQSCDPNTQPYDCEVGFGNWTVRWPEGKKFWCCKYYGRGCTTTTSSPAYDCDAGFANWQRGWSKSKQAWCCKTKHRGCPTTTTWNQCKSTCWLKGQSATCENRIQYSADHEFRGRYHACGLAHKQVLQQCPACHDCGYHQAGCKPPPVTSTKAPRTYSEPYDCQAGLANWAAGWSNAKKVWCCHNKKLGCAQPTTTPVLQGCETHCTTGGQDLTCGSRIRRAAKTLGNRDNACVSALGTVLQECSVCSVCSIQAANCVDRRTAAARAVLDAPPGLPAVE